MLQRRQYWEEKTISKYKLDKKNLTKQMSPDMNLIVLANMSVKLFS